MQAFDNEQFHDFLQGFLTYPSDSPQYPVTAVTVDSLVAGVHFPENTTPEDLACKSLAVNLSDLAAMGAVPISYTLGLSIPGWDESWLSRFCAGLKGLHEQYQLDCVASDIQQGPLSVTVQAQGGLPSEGGLKRSQAKVGDCVCVTGALGDAALALDCLQGRRSFTDDVQALLIQRLNRPEPRVAAGIALLELANAAIDISDGLVADLGHILEESQLGARVELESIPRTAAAFEGMAVTEAWPYMLGGGDDYELCFTLPQDRLAIMQQRLAEQDITVSCIGEIEAQAGLRFMHKGIAVNPEVRAYEHFSRSSV